MIELKTEMELETMAQAGRILARVLHTLERMVVPGVTTRELDETASRIIGEAGAYPTFVGQPPFTKGAPNYPAATCISLNEQVIHGIPSERVIREGDLVSIDCGVTYRGLIADAALSVFVGDSPGTLKHRLVDVTKRALWAAVQVAVPGGRLFDISAAIQELVEFEGFVVVRDFCGHGVGRRLHEDPPVPNVGKRGAGPVLQEGMTLAIEPMVTVDNPGVRILDDGWTVVTANGKPAAHFEHTIAITKNGPRVLTAYEEG